MIFGRAGRSAANHSPIDSPHPILLDRCVVGSSHPDLERPLMVAVCKGRSIRIRKEAKK